MLPSNAPPEYANRETLWNAVEAVEKQWNSQLARRFVLALPRKVPEEMYPEIVREYCKKFFVSQGMVADFAIHDPRPPGHNPHCHVMLALRALDENGKWLSKKEERFMTWMKTGSASGCPPANGRDTRKAQWTGMKEPMDRSGVQAGRKCRTDIWKWWAAPVRVDLRSYEEQGIDVIPTVHMGAAAIAMERKGIQTNLGNLNRDIRAAN